MRHRSWTIWELTLSILLNWLWRLKKSLISKFPMKMLKKSKPCRMRSTTLPSTPNIRAEKGRKLPFFSFDVFFVFYRGDSWHEKSRRYRGWSSFSTGDREPEELGRVSCRKIRN